MYLAIMRLKTSVNLGTLCEAFAILFSLEICGSSKGPVKKKGDDTEMDGHSHIERANDKKKST